MNRVKQKRTVDRCRVEILFTDILILLIGFVTLQYYPNSSLSFWVFAFVFLVNTSRIWAEKQIKVLFEYLIRYRYLISIIVFFVLVICQINGSSIGIFDQQFGKADEGIITEWFGKARAIRSDEWNVQVPYFFSQYYNSYQLNSDFMSMSPQNMIIGYNSPVLDFTLIGKPFIWGYILFGNSVGLSWYWCSKIILYLLVGFEMFRILTRSDYLALFSSVVLVFSPVLQWWLAPHMYQVFFWASTLFVVGYYFFTVQSIQKKILFSILAICSLTGFVIAIFPSLQVGLGLLMLVLLIAQLIQDKHSIQWGRPLIYQVIAVIVVTGAVLGIFFVESHEAISLLNNTVYPGHRVSLGGTYGIHSLFTNPSVALTPFLDPTDSNACEMSTFNHLGVLCFITFPYLAILNRKANSEKPMAVGYALMGAILIESLFMVIGFPEFLAKLTLFSYINRMDMVYGFTAFLLTIWSVNQIHQLRKYISWRTGLLISVVFAVIYVLTVNSYVDTGLRGVVGRKFYYLVCFLFAFMGFVLFTNWRRLFFPMFACWTVISGMLVNPVVVGVESITNHDLVIEGQKLASENPGSRWITTNSLTTQELLLANGIKVLNGVNFYPDLEKWHAIDSQGEYSDIYNRYAHILVNLTPDPTNLKLLYPDAFQLNLNVNSLQTLGVDFIVCGKPEADLLNSSGIDAKEMFFDEHLNQSIYKLNYREG